MEESTVQPQPTPVSWGFGQALMMDGSKQIMIRLDTVTGSTVVFMTVEDFKTFAESASKFSSANAPSGLIVPQPVLPKGVLS